MQSRAVRRLRGVAVDTTALRESRDYRVLVIGGLISGIGTQVTLVALPFQIYVLTSSSFLVGLLGLVELVPLVVVALLGGTLADRMDRRRLLLVSQVVQTGTSLCLVIGAAAGSPPVGVLYLIAAVASGASAVDRPTRAAMVPGLVGPERLRRRSRSTTASCRWRWSWARRWVGSSSPPVGSPGPTPSTWRPSSR